MNEEVIQSWDSSHPGSNMASCQPSQVSDSDNIYPRQRLDVSAFTHHSNLESRRPSSWWPGRRWFWKGRSRLWERKTFGPSWVTWTRSLKVESSFYFGPRLWGECVSLQEAVWAGGAAFGGAAIWTGFSTSQPPLLRLKHGEMLIIQQFYWELCLFLGSEGKPCRYIISC